MDQGSEEREEGEERGRSEEGSWNKEKPQAAWCQGVLQGKLFWGRKKEGRSRCVIHKPCTFPVICLETVEGLKPCCLKIWFSEFCLSGLPFPPLSPCSPKSESPLCRLPSCPLWSFWSYHQHGLTCPFLILHHVTCPGRHPFSFSSYHVAWSSDGLIRMYRDDTDAKAIM